MSSSPATELPFFDFGIQPTSSPSLDDIVQHTVEHLVSDAVSALPPDWKRAAVAIAPLMAGDERDSFTIGWATDGEHLIQFPIRRSTQTCMERFAFEYVDQKGDKESNEQAPGVLVALIVTRTGHGATEQAEEVSVEASVIEAPLGVAVQPTFGADLVAVTTDLMEN